MRVMLRAEIPVEAGNAAVKSGEIAKVIGNFVETAKPESIHFTIADGMRTMFAVFDLASVVDMPRIGEPFFMKLNASMKISPCMDLDDLQKGLAALG
jgi:hypothetical protein